MNKFIVTIETAEDVPRGVYDLFDLLYGINDGQVDAKVTIGDKLVHSLSSDEE